MRTSIVVGLAAICLAAGCGKKPEERPPRDRVMDIYLEDVLQTTRIMPLSDRLGFTAETADFEDLFQKFLPPINEVYDKDLIERESIKDFHKKAGGRQFPEGRISETFLFKKRNIKYVLTEGSFSGEYGVYIDGYYVSSDTQGNERLKHFLAHQLSLPHEIGGGRLYFNAEYIWTDKKVMKPSTKWHMKMEDFKEPYGGEMPPADLVIQLGSDRRLYFCFLAEPDKLAAIYVPKFKLVER